MVGQGTSANPNPPQLGMPLTRPEEQTAVETQVLVANHVTPVAAEVYERQIANIQRRLDQQAALQRRLDQQDEFLRQQEAALALRSRENQERHQSLVGPREHIDPANLFNTPQEHQAGGNPGTCSAKPACPSAGRVSSSTDRGSHWKHWCHVTTSSKVSHASRSLS